MRKPNKYIKSIKYPKRIKRKSYIGRPIKELIKGRVHNVEKRQIEKGKITEDIVVEEDYMFYVYECYGGSNKIPKMDLVVISGHETIIVYNTKTKIFEEIFIR